MKKNNLIQLIKKFLAGQSTYEEQRKLEEWWENSVDDSRIQNSISENEWALLKQEMESNIHSIIREREDQRTKKTVRFVAWSMGLKIAASMLLLIAASITVYYFTTDNVIQTVYGEKRTVVLPDESVVVLNGNSSLRYSRGWNEKEDRAVWLDGEAFFIVKHTANHNRFTVHSSNNLTIEVLGTQFNVNNRKGKTSVILQEGSVRLDDSKSSYTMRPNEMVSHSKNSFAFISQKVEATQKVSWKTNLIVYENESVGSILEKLSESHGVRVIFENETINSEIFNGSIPTDSVTVIFEKIEKLFGVTAIKDDDGIYRIR